MGDDWRVQTDDEIRDTRVQSGTLTSSTAVAETVLNILFAKRITVSSCSSGPANFIFGVNPSFYNPSDSSNINSVEVLHGASIIQKQRYDNRPRIMKWSNFPFSNNNLLKIVNYFNSIKGNVRYFNFNDMNDMNYRWISTATWKKAKVVDLRCIYKEGGDLVYDTVELHIQPEY